MAMNTKLNPEKPDGGETRGTCDGYLRHAPHTEAEHKSNCLKPGLPRWNWKPLAPEATMKEQCGCCGCPRRNCIHDDCSECHGKRFNTVSPGEAVGRETREQQIKNISQWRAIQHAFVTIGRNMEVPMDMRELATRMRDVIEPQCIDLTGELSALRRERDQLKAKCQPHFAMRVDLSAEFAAKMAKLESQVRELTAQRDKQRIGLEKINYIRQSIVGSEQVNWSEHIYPLVAALDEAGLVSLEYGEARNNFGQLFKRNQDLESQVAELRATVEKLERLRAEFIWLAHCPSRPTFCNCRAHVALERELSDMRKGSL